MERHWLYRPATIRKLWVVFIVILVFTVQAELGVQHEPHFAVERLFAFNALYGFLACAALVLIARGIGVLLKRRDIYYEAEERE